MTDAESAGSGGANAAVWLKDAGLDYLISNKGVSNQENNERSAMVMFGSLTRRQSIAVQKRLREVGTVPTVSEHQHQLQQRRRNGKVRGTSDSPLVGRLVSSFSGPLDTPSPQKSCVSVAIGSSLLNAGKRSGSYDLGKLSITDTPGVVLKARRHVDIMEAYDVCNQPDSSCVYREELRGRSASNTSSSLSSVYEGFPAFSLTPCDVGITLACHDLSTTDLVVVRRLAFIESSAVFDELNIRSASLNQGNSGSTNSLMSLLSGKHVAKTTAPSTSASSLPGSSLESMLNKSRSRTSQQTRVPLLIERILDELCSPRCANAEGLFRIPPSQQRLRNLLKDIQSNDFNEMLFDFGEVPPSDLAALLKHIIRSLSPSLLTASLEPQFVLAVSDIHTSSDGNTLQLTNASTTTQQPVVCPVPPSSVVRERLRLLNLLILQLPDANRDTLQLILSGLRYLAGPSSNNRMTASSLALVLAPLFFPSMQALTDSDHIHRQVFVVQLLIIYTDVLFVVPNQLLDQVRLHNTLLNQRNFVSGPKHTRRVAAATGSPVTGDQPVISICTPSLFTLTSPKNSKTVAGSGEANTGMTTTVQLRLRPDMKAAEAVELTVRNVLTVTPAVKSATIPGHEWFMFELDGNIHERCLDPNSLLLSVHRRNPNANWELRLLANNRVLLPDITKSSSRTRPEADAS